MKTRNGIFRLKLSDLRTSRNLLNYILAVAASFLAVGLKIYFEGHGVSTRGPLVFLALTVSAYFGGLGPGLLSAGICSILNLYFFVLPDHSFTFLDSLQWAEFLVFTVGATLVGTLTGSLRDASQKANLSNERALTYANQKAAFAANVSHEIRTPLNAIIGLAEVLGKAKGLSSRNRNLAEKIRTSGDSLLNLLNDILDISKADFNFLQMKVEKFNFIDDITKCVHVFDQMAVDKGLRLSLKIESNLPKFLLGDSSRIFQVCTNLIANAIKFTEKGEVAVLAKVVREHDDGKCVVRIGVRDTGIGLSSNPKIRSRIFEPFDRGEMESDSNIEGVGLGLAICRKLVEKMSGTLQLESELGKGSYFWFELPLRRAEDSSIDVIEPNRIDQRELLTDAISPILVVDDNYVNHLVAAAMLEQIGLHVEVALSGLEALQKTRIKSYSAILMDCQMPDLNGFATTRAIRSEELQSGRPRVPIVAVTAFEASAQKELCLKAGMDEFLPKPLNLSQLSKTLSLVIPRLNSLEIEEPASGESIEYVDQGATLDTDRLNRMAAQMENGSSVVAEMIEHFLLNVPTTLTALKAAALQSDLDEVSKKAHYLFSGSSAIGAINFSRACKELEFDAGLGEVDKVRRSSEVLEQEFVRLNAECSQFLSENVTV